MHVSPNVATAVYQSNRNSQAASGFASPSPAARCRASRPVARVLPLRTLTVAKIELEIGHEVEGSMCTLLRFSEYKRSLTTQSIAVSIVEQRLSARLRSHCAPT